MKRIQADRRQGNKFQSTKCVENSQNNCHMNGSTIALFMGWGARDELMVSIASVAFPSPWEIQHGNSSCSWGAQGLGGSD